MILNLPTEVILTIASYLTLQEKVDLVMTCRSLHTLISKTNLYQELNLLRTNKGIKSIVQKFETYQLDGAQVKTLNIDFDELSEQQYSQISDIFPNVTRFCYNRKYKNISTADLLAKWKDTLEQCDLKDAFGFSLTDMEKLTFPRLTELKLGSTLLTRKINNGFNPTRFLSITKGAPSLKMLCLQRCDINLEFLEGLHANCIHLQSLILKEVMVVIDNEYLLETITPASSILKLEITDYSVIVDTSMSYLDYIVKKYVNLQSLSVSIHMQEDERATASAISSYYGVIQRSHRIFRGHTDAQIEAIRLKTSSLLADIKSTLQVYRNSGGQDFLSRLPKSLNILKLDAGLFNQVIQPLSLSQSNIVRLDIISNYNSLQSIFHEPSDVEYLKKLQHLKTLTTPLYPQVQQYDQMITSISITKLHIYKIKGTLYLGWVLEKLPSLEELYINAENCAIKAVLDGKESMNEAHLRLRYLKITSDIQQEAITLLKKVAPNLKYLHLILRGLAKRDTKMIDLTNWELDKCSIYFDYISTSNNIACIITIGNVTKRLVFQSDRIHYTLLPEHQRPGLFSDRPNHPPVLSLSCDTIQDLKIEGYMIMTFGKYIAVV